MTNFCTGASGGWIKHVQSPVLGGDPGVCFDISMLREDRLFRMYFSWRTPKSVAVVNSADGVLWSEPEICIAPYPSATGCEDDINRPAVIKKMAFIICGILASTSPVKQTAPLIFFTPSARMAYILNIPERLRCFLP